MKLNKDLPVLIIGAGIAGLTLAQALRKYNVPFRIFERDTAAKSRKQGWAIALHSMLDQFASAMPSDVPPLDEANHLLPLENNTAQMALIAPNGKKYFVEGSAEHKIIRANRSKLRDLLCTNIEVQYGLQLTRITEHDDSVAATFQDGTEVQGSIIVGGDGVGSHVRKHILPDVQPALVPVNLITGEVSVRGADLTHQYSIARSAYVAFGVDSHLFCGLNKMSDDGLEGFYYWDVIIESPDKNTTEAVGSAKEQLELAKEKTKAMDPELTRLIDLTAVEGIYEPPLILRDAVILSMPVSRVTLMGDAAHPMVPFRGEGGCHAIRDALNLAQVLTQFNDEELFTNLDVYQKEMLQRGGEAVQKSRSAGSGKQDASSRMAWGTTLKSAS